MTERQIAGGPDLVKEVPNLTFTKTNFTGYNLEIRGIGTQAISVATDPAVAVAFNDTPFLRNHFFEQEFFDLENVQVLRGPQGTLFGRNANAGVVNIISAKPTDHFEAMMSADFGNYNNRRVEGMINLPIIGDKLMLRAAGEWTKRDGYSHNEITNDQIDGRNLWSGRLSLRWKPTDDFRADFIWEHFEEHDDRLRSGKQLCKRDPGPQTFTDSGNHTVTIPPAQGTAFGLTQANFSQGCLPNNLYKKNSFEVVNGFSLPFVSGAAFEGFFSTTIDPYTSTTQSHNLRNIQSALNPVYKANNDTLEFNAEWQVTPYLTLNSETGYNRDFLWSTEDYNRFNTSPDVFIYDPTDGRHTMTPTGNYVCGDGTVSYGSNQCSAGGHGAGTPSGIFCDPQLGCSDRLVVQDLSEEHSWQFSQEFRLTSDFKGPFNFSAGGNYLHYETFENYYVFSNTFTLIALNNVGCDATYIPNVTDNLYCLNNGRSFRDPHLGGGVPTESPQYIDPHPLTNLDDLGHNYFVSQNPYVLNSYALFGEAYYNITKNLKLTGGLRWTDDEKHFTEIPSEVLTQGYGYPPTGQVDQSWKKFTGRAVINWTPQLDFTDQTMVYASYAHGYKAGGANPPGAVLLVYDVGAGTNTSTFKNIPFPVHPPTFAPEYIDAYELGTKNTALDGDLIFNADAFYYDYTGYQISQIVDRTSVNINVDANIWGAEVQTTWSPLPGLKFAFNGGYEGTRIKGNQFAIDLIDRTAGHPGWVVMKPWVGQASNCIFPEYVAAALVEKQGTGTSQGSNPPQACGYAYHAGLDPVTSHAYSSSTTSITGADGNHYSYPGYDPNGDYGPHGGINGGEGFAKPLGGNELPGAPHYTASLTADYTMPVSPDWAATFHTDFYWQSQSWARIFNDRNYDKIHGYANVNLALILTDATGWQIMGYVKNVLDTTAITGTFLNSDDTGLTTNVFLTDPRLYGLRITKRFGEGSWENGGGLDFIPDFFADSDGKRPPIWLTLGGNFNAVEEAGFDPYAPITLTNFPNGGNPTPPWASGLPTPRTLQKSPDSGFDWEGALTFQPEGSDWKLKADVRYGRSSRGRYYHKSQSPGTRTSWKKFPNVPVYFPCYYVAAYYPSQAYTCYHGNPTIREFDDSHNSSSEQHAILDFEVGKDVGIGMFGAGSAGTLSGGVRIAQFDSRNGLIMGADPHYNLMAIYHEVYDFYAQEKRSFHGMGPEVNWDASQPVWGNVESGQLAVDWGVNLGVLFGEQTVHLHHVVKHCYVHGSGSLGKCDGGGIGVGDPRIVEPPDDVNRSQRVTVPNLGAHIGLSMQYKNAKLSFGYRSDEFFGAIDGGEYSQDCFNRGFHGVYMNVSIGLGG